MLAPRNRGAFVRLAFGLLALASACSNGTEPAKPSVCDATNPVTLGAGEVRTPIADACVFVSGGASGGEFALVPFNSDTVYPRTASLAFTSSGVSPVTTPLQSRTLAFGPSLSLTPSGTSPAVVPSYAFDIRLRESERRILTPLLPAARAWYRNRAGTGTGSGLRPSFSTAAAPPVVGDLVTLNTRTGATLSDACQVPDNRTGRVVAVTTHAIVVADTANPTGGYTDAEYLSVGQQFDAVYTMDTGAFGDPTDIDNNGKIIMFFTRAVNEMTPKGSGSVVGGFFYGRDLFPRANTTDFEGCATSNFAEMFYLAVPDPNALVNGNTNFTKNFVSHLTVSTTAHEFQHLINAARRMYVNTTATDFEVVWLNEGLSHIAEELLFYNQSAGLAPRMDIDSMRFKGNQTNVDAYNFNQQANAGRLLEYLSRPATSSPYAEDDSLWTRGATWSFLRYAADHRGTSDGDTWFKLVNSTTESIANLQNVFGANVSAIFRDWAVANVADDLPGVGNEWQHPSWNFRSFFNFLPSVKKYPLATVTVGDNSPLTVTLNGGGAAYVRFTIPANQVGSVKWTTQANGIAMTLVRLK
jgi:hypothetical protein